MACATAAETCRLKKPGDDTWDEIQYPITHRLLEKCDAVLRLEGASAGADNDVRIARERGLKVFYSLAEITPGETLRQSWRVAIVMDGSLQLKNEGISVTSYALLNLRQGWGVIVYKT